MSEPRRCLIFDPFSGISGNMILGALIDLGLPQAWLLQLIDSAPVKADIEIETVNRGSLAATLVTVRPPGSEPERHLSDVLQIIEAMHLEYEAKQLAAATFRRLADVEASIHGVPPERIHFHEVGAVDAIIDITATAAGIVQLGIGACYTRAVAVGHGWVEAEHGRLPVPAPATLRLLEGLPVRESGVEAELTTPTGAALLSQLTQGQRASGTFTPIRTGLGAGSRDPATHPNCLRLIMAQLDVPGRMFIVQADIDDMSPEYVPPLREALDNAGARDVLILPVQMKKGRSGLRVEALVGEDCRDAVGQALFENSTTLGMRFWPVDRQVLPRASNRIEWRGFPIRVKISTTPEGHVMRKPEYDDITQAARALGMPPFRARQEVQRLLDSEPST